MFYVKSLLCYLNFNVFYIERILSFQAWEHARYYRNLKQLIMISREQTKFTMLSLSMLYYVTHMIMLYETNWNFVCYVTLYAMWCIHENNLLNESLWSKVSSILVSFDSLDVVISSPSQLIQEIQDQLSKENDGVHGWSNCAYCT